MLKRISHPALEATTQIFVDGLASGQPIQTLTPTDAHAVLSGMQKAAQVTLPDVQIKEAILPARPTSA
jgi:acetyl esterase